MEWTALAWPIAVVAIATMYRNAIQANLSRLRKLSPAGVELDTAQPEQKAVESAAELVEQTLAPPSTTPEEIEVHIRPVELRALPGFSWTPAIGRVELELHNSLQSIQESDRLHILIRALAQSKLETTFERIYRVIYGSQISGLRRLNETGQATIFDAHIHFEPVFNEFPAVYKEYGFDGWLSFLVDSGLVRREQEMLYRTDLGQDFLLYLTNQCLRDDKPY